MRLAGELPHKQQRKIKVQPTAVTEGTAASAVLWSDNPRPFSLAHDAVHPEAECRA